MSAEGQGHHFREEEAKTNQTTDVAISVEPLWGICADSRSIEAGLSWLVEERGF